MLVSSKIWIFFIARKSFFSNGLNQKNDFFLPVIVCIGCIVDGTGEIHSHTILLRVNATLSLSQAFFIAFGKSPIPGSMSFC